MKDLDEKHENEKLKYVTKISDLLDRIESMKKEKYAMERKMNELYTNAIDNSQSNVRSQDDVMNKAPLLRDTRDNATMTVKITKDSTSATIKEDYLKAQNRIIELEGIVENLLYKSKTQIYKDEKPKTKSTSTFTAETPTKSASTFTTETPTP